MLKIPCLKEMQKKLALAGDELLRMEYESGISLNAKQASEVDDYFMESRSIERVLQLPKNEPFIEIRTEIGNDMETYSFAL